MAEKQLTEEERKKAQGKALAAGALAVAAIAIFAQPGGASPAPTASILPRTYEVIPG